MIKIIQTNDRSLPRRQEGWRNSKSSVVGGSLPNIGSTVSDSEIDQISGQLDGQCSNVESKSCDVNKGPINDVRQFEIDQYMKNFVKQNGSIISKDSNITDTKKSEPKVLLG